MSTSSDKLYELGKQLDRQFKELEQTTQLQIRLASSPLAVYEHLSGCIDGLWKAFEAQRDWHKELQIRVKALEEADS